MNYAFIEAITQFHHGCWTIRIWHEPIADDRFDFIKECKGHLSEFIGNITTQIVADILSTKVKGITAIEIKDYRTDCGIVYYVQWP